MIAAAMANRKSAAPQYSDLARADAEISREVEPDQCRRLTDVTLALGRVRAQLRFGVDDQARMCVAGEATADVTLTCHMCLEPVELVVQARIDGVLVRSEEEAQSWQAQAPAPNMMLVSGQELDVADLIEDELILALPARVCMDEQCERRPQLDYAPAAEELAYAAENAPATDDNPFAVLETLKARPQDS